MTVCAPRLIQTFDHRCQPTESCYSERTTHLLTARFSSLTTLRRQHRRRPVLSIWARRKAGAIDPRSAYVAGSHYGNSLDEGAARVSASRRFLGILGARGRLASPAMSTNSYTVSCLWDTEAGMWYVAETDVPGLATEAATLEEMERKLLRMIPELLELNGAGQPWQRVPFELIARKLEFAPA